MKLARIMLLLAAAGLFAQDADEIRSILVNRVDESHKAAGMVVGAINPDGRHVFGRGRLIANGAAEPDGDTVFEIGSITKVFTSLLLADMIERGEVHAEDPVASFLPPGVTMPARNGRQVTLLDLSMHVSGLPRVPTNMTPADMANPYADYDAAKLHEFLSRYALERDVGEKYEYSNLGVGLLGYALARKAGMSYEQLVQRRILEPLGMQATSITLSERQKKRLAVGHNPSLEAVKNWDIDVLAGAGGLRSTANDMLKFAAAHLELTGTPLKGAVRRMRTVHRETGTAGLEIGMGWHIVKRHGAEIVWHNGATAGYTSFLGLDPAKKRAVIVLCNTALNNDDAGLHFLEGRFPVAKFPTAQP